MPTNLDRCNYYTDGELANLSFLNIGKLHAELKLPNLSEDFFNHKWISYGKAWGFYGADNLFPQILRYLSMAPYNAACLQIKADMVVGEGLQWSQNPGEKQALDNFFDNCVDGSESGYTINDLLRKLTHDYFTFGGLACLLRCNGGKIVDEIGQDIYGNPTQTQVLDVSKRQIVKLDYLPYESIRLSRPDSVGNVHDIWYSFKWENYLMKKGYNPSMSPRFDGRKNDATQVYYDTDDKFGSNYYPLPSWYPAINHVLATMMMSEYSLSSLENGMIVGGIITYPHEKPLIVKDQTSDLLEAQHVGVRNGNKILEIYGSTDSTGKGTAASFLPLNANDNAGIFKDTYQSAVKNILNQHRVPGALMEFSVDDKMVVNSNMQKDAIKMMTPLIKQGRNKILGFLKSVLKFNQKNNPELTNNAIDTLNFTDTNYRWEE